MSVHKLLLTVCVLTISLSAQDAREWTKRTFSASPDRVFVAALQSIAAQHYEVLDKNDDKKTVRFKVGKCAFSWGYVMMLEVSSTENNVSNVSIDIAGVRGPGPEGKVSLVAKGKKEVEKIFQGIDNLLTHEPSSAPKDTH
jgi:hypothetical protein